MNNKTDAKDKIIKAFLDLISEKGNAKVTVREISKRADVNLASINYHFRTTQNLFNEVENYFTDKIFQINKIFEDSGLDVLGASSYKWLLAGYGNGFMLFKDRVKEFSKVETIGFNAANTNPELKNSIRFAKHFEPGHLDTLNFGTLKHSLGL